MNINVKEARNQFASLLNRVQEGDEVSILRHGKEVARLIPPQRGVRHLPSLKAFRSTIRMKGESLSSLVIRARGEERC
ncbi:MAG: type II toxin-antitoxin system prevent-host-death family antitoxin [Chlamydiae bacterium]|nr:type II toxin-antitoxin system prevent-host-death family antitoxin [Chlamydiota bacterium]MBI3276134.1 type II toxin-antitoxin system prevent-host-death family antitoxin [Chlamydiota bacterium]